MRKHSFFTDSTIQWLVVVSIAQFRVETIVMLLILLTTRWRGFESYLKIGTMLLLHIMIMVVIYGYGMWKPLQQLLLIGIHGIGYYTFFKRRVSNIDDVWDKYLQFCYIVALAGIFQLLCMITVHVDPFKFIGSGALNIDDDGVSIRLHSFYGEPGYLSVYLLPYICYGILNFQTINKTKFYVVLFVFLLTFSATGFAGLFLFGLYKLMISKYKVIPIFLIPILLSITFNATVRSGESEEKSGLKNVLYKINETYNAFYVLDPVEFELFNASTYATMSNLWVSMNAPSRLVGTGIGTHAQNYVRLYKSDFNYYGLNKEDAYSLSIRIFSEFGIMGLFVAIFMLVNCFNKRNSINISVLFYVFAIMIRGGHYTANGVFFFCMIYYITSKRTKRNTALQNS